VPKGKHAKAFVYRIHDIPDSEKLDTLNAFILRFGHKIKTEGNKVEVAKSINSLLDKVQGRPEENLVETIAIRTMSKAVYSTKNVGHYGLAFDYYTHFTSPIRRYPDMMVHRLLERYLDGGRSVDQTELELECKHSSDMEQVAANAERDSIKYKQVEFMADKIGKVYDGVVSGITEWGIYVEINENKCEGMIPIRELDDDFYELDEKNYRLVGRRTKREYRLGQPVSIQVAKANLERKQLDFVLA
jgi:ribonuclease R